MARTSSKYNSFKNTVQVLQEFLSSHGFEDISETVRRDFEEYTDRHTLDGDDEL